MGGRKYGTIGAEEAVGCIETEHNNNRLSPFWAITDTQRTVRTCLACWLLYTSDAADDPLCVDLGGLRIITKKHTKQIISKLHSNILYIAP